MFGLFFQLFISLCHHSIQHPVLPLIFFPPILPSIAVLSSEVSLVCPIVCPIICPIHFLCLFFSLCVSALSPLIIFSQHIFICYICSVHVVVIMAKTRNLSLIF